MAFPFAEGDLSGYGGHRSHLGYGELTLARLRGTPLFGNLKYGQRDADILKSLRLGEFLGLFIGGHARVLGRFRVDGKVVVVGIRHGAPEIIP